MFKGGLFDEIRNCDVFPSHIDKTGRRRYGVVRCVCELVFLES